ncbi:MAG: hypothetical protein ACYDCL_12165 [Myxococcales bacterium]
MLACGTSSHGGGSTGGSSGGASSGGGGSSSSGGTGGASSGGSTGGSSGGSVDAGHDGGFDAGREDGGRDAGAGDGGRCGFTFEYGLCNVDADCVCPFHCNPDDPLFEFSGAPGSVCELPCATSADCPDLYTSCQSGYCAYDPCDVTRTALGLPPNGWASGVCDSADAGDGTCVVRGDGLAVCEQGGSSIAGCDAGATRGSPGELCVPGSLCVGGVCRPGCDALDGGACPGGLGCGAIDPTQGHLFPGFGACFPILDAGGCLAGMPAANEMAPCGPTAGCACLDGGEAACTADPVIGPSLNPYGAESYCERGCAATSDCVVPTTVCSSGRCSDDFCGRTPGGQDAGSAWDAPCDAAGQGDGTCVPMRTALADPAYGLCVQGGNATAVCAAGASRDAAAWLCGAGSVCAGLPDGGAGCFPACNPGLTSSCPTGGPCVGSNEPGASAYLGSCP